MRHKYKIYWLIITTVIVVLLFNVTLALAQGQGQITVPSFINQVPPNHFAGISHPSQTLQEARSSAISDVAKQILGSISAEYNHTYINRTTGTPQKPKRLIHDHLSKITSGIVLDIEKNIIKASHTNNQEKIIYFMLVKYPNAKIQEMKRLSKGAHVTGTLISSNNKTTKIKVTETNGVAATITTANIEISKKNRLADFYNYYVCKVREGSNRHFTTTFTPIRIKGSDEIITLNLKTQNQISDLLLGAKQTIKVRLKGFDELGRDVVTLVTF